jgi:hypothetical protein
MQVSIITTINHNVGDDFVREGIFFLLEQSIGPFSAQLIHKHIPVTARPEMEWYYNSGISRLFDKLPRGRGLFWSKVLDSIPINHETDKILSCDLLVQSGAPVYWQGAHNSEWYGPLIVKRYRGMSKHPPLVNLGAGTCLPYFSVGDEILSSPNCIAFIKDFHASCKVTTLRDSLSKTILNQIGLDAPVIPCPSIFARDRLGVNPQTPEYVAVNFMEMGGHYEFGQKIDTSRWINTFKEFVTAVSRNFPVVFSCHDGKELASAKNHFPEAKWFMGKTARDYLDFYSRAKFFIGCRVHAAFATASFGRPAFVIGSDTRAKMTEEIGLQSIYVNEADPEKLVAAYHDMNRVSETYPVEFQKLRDVALDNYFRALLPVKKSLLPKG